MRIGVQDHVGCPAHQRSDGANAEATKVAQAAFERAWNGTAEVTTTVHVTARFAPSTHADNTRCFGKAEVKPDAVMSFSFSVSQKLNSSAALVQTIKSIPQMVEKLTQAVFSQMQTLRDVVARDVPSSFAAACPHGGNQQRPDGYGEGVGTQHDYGTGYGPAKDPAQLTGGLRHWDSFVDGGGTGTEMPWTDGSGSAGYTVGGGHSKGPDALGEMPHDMPTADQIAGYKPGGGCPVMGQMMEGQEGGSEAEAPLRRLFEADYSDGTGGMSGGDRPNAREISNAVVGATGDRKDASGATDLFWGWGQFLDHDLSLTHGADEAANIAVPHGDARFDPNAEGGKDLGFIRSASEQDSHGVRQQTNSITALIDGSNVYGSSQAEETSLREGEGGRMLLDARGNLPRDDNGFFRAGDVRVNENPLLTSLHTVFAREHNRLAADFAERYPSWSDDQIFDAAREINVAQMQSVTANEFLPMLLGKDAMGAYPGYTGTDPQISNAFSTAAFRFGHSMVSDKLQLIDEHGNRSDIPLMDAFFNTKPIDQGGIDDVLRGAAGQRAQAMDTEIVDSLRNNVMPGPDAHPLDLAALNIQRGRDHGLPSLNDMKRGLGQPPLTGFDDPRLRDGVGERLAQVYDSIEDVDAWVGMLAEKPVGGGMAGETQAAVLVEQFRASRNGDPDWYEGKFPPATVARMNNTSLADIIERNVLGTDIQDYAMLSAHHQALA